MNNALGFLLVWSYAFTHPVIDGLVKYACQTSLKLCHTQIPDPLLANLLLLQLPHLSNGNLPIPGAKVKSSGSIIASSWSLTLQGHFVNKFV